MTDNTLISLEHVAAGYGDNKIFHDVSLTVREHDFIGVVGPNGGGKTTLMRVILGLMKPMSGRVSYYRGGRQVKNLLLGYLPQYTAVDRQFPISVGQVVLSGLNNRKSLLKRCSGEHRDMAHEMLSRLGMDDAFDRHIGTLSGGQLQRVLLARALVSHPEVVILDEPNTYIDKKFQKQMYEILHDINRDCAVVMVSHNLGEVVRHVKSVALVSRGVKYKPVAGLSGTDIEDCFGCPAETFAHKALVDICMR